jgi:hypothetical protein
MCMVDDSDGRVEVLREFWRVARVAHKCAECRRRIEPGERYLSHCFKFDGEFTQHKFCEHCDVVRRWLQDECGGFLYRGVEEDLREHATSGWYGRGVMRLAVGMDWFWRAPSGRMLPVPSVPPTTHEAKSARA